jgi:hypothetical protein
VNWFYYLHLSVNIFCPVTDSRYPPGVDGTMGDSLDRTNQRTVRRSKPIEDNPRHSLLIHNRSLHFGITLNVRSRQKEKEDQDYQEFFYEKCQLTIFLNARCAKPGFSRNQKVKKMQIYGENLPF